jgi:hypothetical protein
MVEGRYEGPRPAGQEVRLLGRVVKTERVPEGLFVLVALVRCGLVGRKPPRCERHPWRRGFPQKGYLRRGQAIGGVDQIRDSLFQAENGSQCRRGSRLSVRDVT